MKKMLPLLLLVGCTSQPRVKGDIIWADADWVDSFCYQTSKHKDDGTRTEFRDIFRGCYLPGGYILIAKNAGDCVLAHERAHKAGKLTQKQVGEIFKCP